MMDAGPSPRAGWTECDYLFPGDRPCVLGVHPDHHHDHRPAKWLLEDHYTRLAAAVRREAIGPVKTAGILRELYVILGERATDTGGDDAAERLAAYVNDLANMLEDYASGGRS